MYVINICSNSTPKPDLTTTQKLPVELEIQIIEHFILSDRPCVKDALFNTCHDPWSCPFIHVSTQPESTQKSVPGHRCYLPNHSLLNVSKKWNEEVYKAFVRNNIFLFNTLSMVHTNEFKWNLSDHYAASILQLTDMPDYFPRSSNSKAVVEGLRRVRRMRGQ